MKQLFILVTSTLFAALLTTACGQRGPLVLPPPESRQPDTRPTQKPVATPTALPIVNPKQ